MGALKLVQDAILRVTCDFETRSKSNLKLEGAYKYSLDPSTQPTCLAIKVRGSGRRWFFKFHEINRQWVELPIEFRRAWVSMIKQGHDFSAHNAFFETCIYKNILVKRYGWPDIPFDQFHCTAAKAAACALPRNLAGAGEALKLTIQKDKNGYVAMMATCRPTRAWNAWTKAHAEVKAGKRVGPKKLKLIEMPEPPVFLEPEAAPDVWRTLYRYCEIDVDAEELLDKKLPDLIPMEKEIWLLNQRLNWRGLYVDIPLIQKIVSIMEVESRKKLKELDKLTMGLITKPGARTSILNFLADEGIILPNIQAKTVADIIAEGKLSPEGKKLLEIRQALSKTSTKKYQTFLNRANADARVRDILMYHGASTGRDTGTGIQPQNFPKGIIKVDKNRPYAAVDNVRECDEETLRLLYGESLAILFSSILRNMILPSPGCDLYVADFSKIEVAVCWWAADNEPGLKILRSGKDPYIYQASANTGKTYADIESAVNAGEKWAEDARQLGKAQVLGCQFGMGPDRFQESAWDMYRLKLSAGQSRQATQSYREKNAAVPLMWKAVERAAIYAVENPGKQVTTHKCKFYVEKKFLCIELPSGRVLRYRDPQITWEESKFGPRRVLEFWGVHPKFKKWMLERTWGGKITENIIQAIARDLMFPAMVRLEKADYKVLLAVHDEALCDKKKGTGSLDEFIKILCQIPTWGKGLPVEAKGWVGPRYKK